MVGQELVEKDGEELRSIDVLRADCRDHGAGALGSVASLVHKAEVKLGGRSVSWANDTRARAPFTLRLRFIALWQRVKFGVLMGCFAHLLATFAFDILRSH